MNSFAELKQAIDHVEIYGRYVELTPSGKNHKACCPFHDEKTPSFYVFENGGYHCQGCKRGGGSVIDFLMEKEKCSEIEAAHKAADIAGVPRLESSTPGQDDAEQARKKRQFVTLQRVVEFYEHCLGKDTRARAYLRKRGFDDEAIKRFRIGYAPASGTHLHWLYKKDKDIEQHLKDLGLLREHEGREYAFMRDRIVFPILRRTANGTKAASLTGRFIGDNPKAPKYLTLEDTPWFCRNEDVFGQHTVEAKPEVIRVVEGPPDVVRTHLATGDAVVTPMGTSISEAHIAKLTGLSDRLDFIFDGDKAGCSAKREVISMLPDYMDRPLEVRFAKLPAGDDPDSFFAKHAFDECEFEPLEVVMVNMLVYQFELDNQPGVAARARALDVLTNWLDRVGNPAMRAVLSETLHSALSLPPVACGGDT